MRKFLSITLVAVLLVSCFAIVANAADEKVSVRIEGKYETYFSGDVALGESNTVLDVIKAIDDADDSLNVTYVDSGYGAYISGINGDNETTENIPDPDDPENLEKAKQFYIGWMYAVNNQNASVGVSAYELQGGEDIVLYYCDMNAQVPVADFSEKGKIKLTSYDWLPDWSGIDWMPVANVNVTLNGNEYVSDSEGVVSYNPDDFKCLVNIQVYNYDELGYPLVCRFPENYGFDMHSFKDEEPATSEATSEVTSEETSEVTSEVTSEATSEVSSEATSEAAPVVEKAKPVTINYKQSLYVKKTYQIDITTDEKVKYSSSNSKVATVSANGKITAQKAGTAVITAKAGNVTAKYKITVNNPKLNVKSKTIKKGKSFTLKVTGATGKVKYSSSKSSVAKVNANGKVTGKKMGKAEIKVVANGVTLKCKVTVK